jgi:hypothetical protein
MLAHLLEILIAYFICHAKIESRWTKTPHGRITEPLSGRSPGRTAPFA